MEDFLNDLMTTVERDITDAVFLLIEHDKSLMERYLRLIAGGLSLKKLNSSIGERIKEHFRLENETDEQAQNIRNEPARSKLIITSHQRFQPWAR